MGRDEKRNEYGGLGLALALVFFALGTVHADSEESLVHDAALGHAEEPLEELSESDVITLNPAPLYASRAFALDLFRLGFPSGIGIGFRYLPLPELALEAGLSTMVLATGVDLSIAAYPAPGGTQRLANFLVRIGYRTASLHGLADRMIVLVVPSFPAEGQLTISGAHLGFLYAQLGASYRSRGPLLFEMSVGYMIQLGTASSSVGGRAALSQAGARFPIGEIRLSYHFDRKRRR